MTSTTAPAAGSLRGWATGLVPSAPESAAPARTDQPGRGTLRALGAAMVGAPLAMTAWFMVEPAVLPREDPAVFLGSIAAAPERYLVATALVALAGALAVVAALGTARLLRPHLPRTATALGLVLGLSGLGLAAQVGFRAVVAAPVLDGGPVPASALESYAAFQGSGLFDALLLPGLLFGALGTVLLVVALVRSRVVARWVPVAVVAGTVLASGEFPDAVTVSGAALSAGAQLTLARALLAQRP